LIIHIGQAKVLSTFLQKEVFAKIDKVVWSDEDLSGLVLNWRSGSLTRDVMLQGLKVCYPDAKIIVCIRKPWNSWVGSIYNQYVKQGGFKSFDSFVKEDFDTYFLYQDYYVSTIKKIFNDVFVLDFSTFIKNKSGVISDLCTFIGCDVPYDIDYDKIYNKGWSGFRLFLGRLRAIAFKASRIFMECDKNG